MARCFDFVVGRALFTIPILLFLLMITFIEPELISTTNRSLLTDFNNADKSEDKKIVLNDSRIAICLFGEGKHFDLTGSSIINNVLRKYPSADLFVSTTMDSNTYKFFILQAAPHIAAIHFLDRPYVPITSGYIYNPKSSLHSGLQGMLQIFEMQFRCLELILDREIQNSFKYDWILHMRADGYWSKPLDVDTFHATKYTAPKGSRFGGLNDRLGIGSRSSGVVSLGRYLKWIDLMEKGCQNLTSERALKALLWSSKLAHRETTLPFCVVSERLHPYPPAKYDIPVAFIGSKSMLSGAECRPCIVECMGQCAEHAVTILEKDWAWIEAGNGLALCNGSAIGDITWERIFDTVAPREAAKLRKTIINLKHHQCLRAWKMMMAKTGLTIRNVQSANQICDYLPSYRSS